MGKRIKIPFNTWLKNHLEDLTPKQKQELDKVTVGFEKLATAASMRTKRKTLLGPKEIVMDEKKYWQAMGKAINELNLPYLSGWKFK